MTKFNPKQKLNLVVIPKKMKDSDIVVQCIHDIFKIAKHINTSLPKKVILTTRSGGGRCYNKSRIMVSIKNPKYTRHILIHEMLHKKGLSHGLKRRGELMFSSGFMRDSFSTKNELEIFGHSQCMKEQAELQLCRLYSVWEPYLQIRSCRI
jgi:hypothetical protein